MKRTGIRKWFIRIGIITGIIMAGLVLILAGTGVWLTRRSWPKVNGTISVPGLQAKVEVIRDRWGVPHIYAQNEHDLIFAQGYVHAQDRLWQMEMQRRIASGRLSEILGKITLNSDQQMRIPGLRRVAEQSWPRITEEGRQILETYAEGMNAYIQSHRDVICCRLMERCQQECYGWSGGIVRPCIIIVRSNVWPRDFSRRSTPSSRITFHRMREGIRHRISLL